MIFTIQLIVSDYKISIRIPARFTYHITLFSKTKKKHVITGNTVCSGPDRGDAALASVPVEGDPAFEEGDPWVPATSLDSSPQAG